MPCFIWLTVVKITFSAHQHLLDVSKRWRDALRPMREDQARADALSVPLAQPHRRGNDDPRLESSLGRFCASAGLHSDLYRAGCRYREVVIQARQAMGLPNSGWSGGRDSYGEVMDDEKAGRRANETRDRQEEYDRALKRVALSLPTLMKNLCVLEIEHNQQDRHILIDGLVALEAISSQERKKRS